jgi:hypothetical protein
VVFVVALFGFSCALGSIVSDTIQLLIVGSFGGLRWLFLGGASCISQRVRHDSPREQHPILSEDVRYSAYCRSGEGTADWKSILAVAERTGGVEYYLIEQAGSRFSELETVERCLQAFRTLHPA